MTKKEELEAEIAATVAELPQCPQPNAARIVIDRKLMQKEALVFGIEQVLDEYTGKHVRKAVVHCTSCGKTFITDYRKKYTQCWRGGEVESFSINVCDDVWKSSHEYTKCPHCLNEVSVQRSSQWYGSHYQLESKNVFSIHNVRNHFCILSWVCRKHTDKSGKISYEFERNEGILLVGKRFVRVTGMIQWCGSGCTLLKEWEQRKRFDDFLGNIDIMSLLPFDMQDIYETEAANSAIDKYLTSNALFKDGTELSAYIRVWSKKKNIENLSVQGFGRIVAGALHASRGVTKIDFEKLGEYIDLSKAKPHQILGLEKDELSRAKRWSFGTYMVYKTAKQLCNVKLTPEQLKIADKLVITRSGLLDFFSAEINGFKPNVIRTLNYLSKEYERAEYGNRHLVGLHYLRDYWNALYKVNGEMDPALLYPKDLIKAHDDMNAKVKEKADRELDKNIRKYSEAYAHLAFVDEETGLQIFPAPTHQSLINEGKTLHHCVATYAKSVASGITLILFIRRIDEPDTPFYTLEYRNGAVAQNRGLKNCARTAEVKAFEEKWLKFINKKGKKNGKRNSKQSEQHAVA